ncbi:MAG: acyl-CoA thioesterase II [Microbacterium sp.]
MLDVLQLEQTTARTQEDIFVGHSHPLPGGRVFGGQVLAQVVTAAARTTPPDHLAHSLHGYFLRPGSTDQDITFGVDRIHDGRSFSRRRVQGYQNGVPIFSGIISFQNEDPGPEHQLPMPDVPGPDEVEADAPPLHPLTGRSIGEGPVEVRHVTGGLYFEKAQDTEPRQCVWIRTRGRIGDDPLLHQAALAYLSDHTIQEPPLRATGHTWATPGLKNASLDHAMWWHRPARVDEWLLYVQESPSAQGGRGLALARIYTQDGVLAATVAQETMMRVPGAMPPA